MKPVLFVTNHVPPDRAGAFAALHEREQIELALFGGRSHHATAGVADPGVPYRRVAQRDVFSLVRSGEHRAVVCGTAGRLALPAAWGGARRAGLPFVLWSALWAHPRTAAHILGGSALMHTLYRRADAVVAYGPHVADFAARHGARRVVIAPQAVDGEFWSASGTIEPSHAFTVVHVGRPAPYKGIDVLLAAWQRSGLAVRDDARLLLIGAGARAPVAPNVTATPLADAASVRNFLAAADVLVMPAIRTPRALEPWGLVANEAMHQRIPIIATDAVGAAAGGLVRNERNGLVVAGGDPDALAAALVRLHEDPQLRAGLGAAGARDVAPYTFAAWAAGFSHGLRAAHVPAP